MKKVTLFLLLLSMIACNKAQEKTTIEPEKPQTKRKNKGLKIESFKDFPEEIDGAACYFASDKKNFEKERYIYADNIENTCYIKIGGKFIRLELAEKTVDSTGRQFLEKFKNDEFELSIDFRQTGDDGDETGIFEGSMSIKHKDEPEQKTKLYGSCGC